MKINRFVSVSFLSMAILSDPSALMNAAVLTNVPMQGGMAMPMVAYHEEHGHLHVMMPTEIPQLTPLLVSNPNDQFDSADPWFDVLDPSRRGHSFSRRYGFVMDTMSDPLPANAAIWLRKISGASDLSFYRYSSSTPKTWQPIFGTEGSSKTLFWNGDMFHPVVTAPASTNALEATFEAYLVDTTTGLEIPDSASEPLLFQWTNVSDGRPALDIGIRVLVTWPTSTAGYVLETAESADAANWTTVTNASINLATGNAILLDSGSQKKFFRMRRQP